jgi:fumarylpyruvate hydrolase
MNLVVTPPPPVTVPVQGGGEFPVHRIYCVGRNYAEHAVRRWASRAASRRSSS